MSAPPGEAIIERRAAYQDQTGSASPVRGDPDDVTPTADATDLLRALLHGHVEDPRYPV